MKPRPPSNPQNLDDLMVMAVDFAGFNLRSGHQTPPTLLAVTKKGPLFFTPDSLQDDRSKDDFADTARLICIAYQVPAAVMILESWMKMAAEGEKLGPDERPAEAIDRHEVVMVMGEAAGPNILSRLQQRLGVALKAATSPTMSFIVTRLPRRGLVRKGTRQD